MNLRTLFILHVFVHKQNLGFVLFFTPHPRTCLLILEREERRNNERGRSAGVGEKHAPLAYDTHPDRVLNLQPTSVP